MPDVYANIRDADVAVQERLADVQELRAADPKQQAMLASYLEELDLPADARVLEIGCGSGAIARAIAARGRAWGRSSASTRPTCFWRGRDSSPRACPT